MPMDLIDADAQAVRATLELTSRIKPEDLTRPTPCASWDLRALLAHMTVQHEGFAAAASGRGLSEAVWRPRPQEPQPVSAYALSAEAVLAAFAGDDVLERPFHLLEIRPEPLPGRVAVGFHLVDYVAHGWDVAATLGIPWEPPIEAVEAALPIARAVPDGERRLQPGASFAPGLPVTPETPPAIEFLAILGRSSTWQPKLS